MAKGLLSVKKPKSNLAKLLSFNQHRKRFGAAEVIKEMHHSDYDSLKTTIIAGDQPEYTYGSDKDLQSHINALKKEFIGQPEINYYHAKLIVLIRRDYETQEQFQQFAQLWQSEHEFLIKNLNTRWLISACDTFIDYSDDPMVKALLMNAVLLINTIKLQESERYLQGTETAEVVEARQASLTRERLALFDGVAGFAVGTDDTIRNMRWRLEALAELHYLGAIVIEIFDRVQLPDSDTVYSRFRQLHTREKTAWWKE